MLWVTVVWSHPDRDASATQNPGSCSATEFERYCLEQNGGRLPFGVAQVLPAGLSWNRSHCFFLCCGCQCCLHSRWANLFGTRSLHVRAWQDKESSLRQVKRILALNEFEKRAYDKGPVPLPEEIPTLHRSDFQTLHRTAEPVIEGFFFIFERLEWQFSGRNWMVCEADSQADEEVRGLATEISCAMQQLLVTWSLD